MKTNIERQASSFAWKTFCLSHVHIHIHRNSTNDETTVFGFVTLFAGTNICVSWKHMYRHTELNECKFRIVLLCLNVHETPNINYSNVIAAGGKYRFILRFNFQPHQRRIILNVISTFDWDLFAKAFVSIHSAKCLPFRSITFVQKNTSPIFRLQFIIILFSFHFEFRSVLIFWWTGNKKTLLTLMKGKLLT